MIDQIRKLREARRAADASLFGLQNRLRAAEARLLDATRQGRAGADQAAIVRREIDALTGQIQTARTALGSLGTELGQVVDAFVLPQTPQQLASQLDDSLPCVLLPVRMETRFMGPPDARELWVRVYPDDIAVHSHENALTRDEALAGLDYWTTIAAAAGIEDAAERARVEEGAWRALINSAGGTRAAWIATEIERRARAKPENNDLSFLLLRARVPAVLNDPQLSASQKRDAIRALLGTTHPFVQAVRNDVLQLLPPETAIDAATRLAVVRVLDNGALVYLGFDAADLKPESWSRAPRTEVLPDRFVLVGIGRDARQEWVFPAVVPNPLIVGPNPQDLEAELSQRDGDLVVGSDFAWIWDFDAAVKAGMAMRVPLPEPFASSGFDRLMVIGLRVSDGPADHAAQLEGLIDNHHYSPGGFAILPQGTPTNHTADARSGASVDDAEGDDSAVVETGAVTLEAVSDDAIKTDGQRLCEALDIRLETLARVGHADGQDVSRAKLMNRAMWPATLGYYLEELLEIDPASADAVRAFFTADVVARGSVPAIRVATQPYGVFVTSSFNRWTVHDVVDGPDAAFLRRVTEVLARVQAQWQQLVPQLSHVDAAGDSFAHLLNILGLQPTSVDYQRRIGTYRDVLWNLAHLMIGGNFGGSDPIGRYFQEVTRRGIQVVGQLGFQFPRLPRLFGLMFSEATSGLNGPLVDDVATSEDEKLSEEHPLPAKYAVAAGDDPDAVDARNYVGWLVGTSLEGLKQQTVTDVTGTSLPVPVPLLYRLLHRALLLASYDATMNLYEEVGLVATSVRPEQDFTNVDAGRTVTRWEFMEGRVDRVMPDISSASIAIADYLATPAGLARPAADLLREVREAIAGLEMVPTAELERLTAEHLDLCSYRLDAWQGALFSRRLARLNALRAGPEGSASKRGVHLGAYGWLENVRPSPPAIVGPREEIPAPLREDGVSVVLQPGNGGFIHGPSINHAVAAAVLRNAYLTHADQQNAAQFSVQLTSERVRTAMSFLEGVRNGQELGALLGYQFERALHDRYVVDGRALAQFILAFRKRFPLVADKVTPDATNQSIERKEAYQVVDGYALVEAVFLATPPLAYPYGVEGLPADPNDQASRAIIAEVERLRDTLDAIADLSLAEGVFQVTQGNYDRAGAMLKAITEGHAPPEPEISRTPRGGAVVNHRIAIHFAPGVVDPPWDVPDTPRAVAAPGLNKWIGDRLGPLDSLAFSVRYDLDPSVAAVPVAALAIQPIDLVHLAGDEAGAVRDSRQTSSLTELEARIDHAYRRSRRASDPDFDNSGRTTIEFMSHDGFPGGGVRTMFEMLPVLRPLRDLITSSRPLAASDYVLPSEQRTDEAEGGSPTRWDLEALDRTVRDAAIGLKGALHALNAFLGDVPADALNQNPDQVPDLSGVDYEGIRLALVGLSYYALAGAFPKQAFLPEDVATPAGRLALLRARQSLIEQAVLTHENGTSRHAQAESLRTFADLSQEAKGRLTAAQIADRFQRAAGLILGDAFRVIPAFTFGNQPELLAARAFANAPAAESLLRFTQQRLASAAEGSLVSDWRPLAVEEWMQGVAAVRTSVRPIDALLTCQETFESAPVPFEPLQLPFDARAHWIAMEFPAVAPDQLDDPDVFVPRGDFLSMVRHLPAGHSESGIQAGLLVDEWTEVIPNRTETTGIAVHYNQPNTEPPQCVIVAVSPTITGRWTWDDLVDTLADTFDRAKRRAVEPDLLRTTPYAQLLPAVLSTFTSHPFGTISTNLAAQPASMVVGN